eukprot:SAG22_NODE_447_length_10412_cov_7.930088_2_plen_79_part_00
MPYGLTEPTNEYRLLMATAIDDLIMRAPENSTLVVLPDAAPRTRAQITQRRHAAFCVLCFVCCVQHSYTRMVIYGGPV